MIRFGINGFGRIGRAVFRIAAERGGFEVVALNDLTDAATLAHLLKYDSTFGRFEGKVEVAEGALVVNGKRIPVLAEKDPAKLPWKSLGSRHRDRVDGRLHGRAPTARSTSPAGAKKVLLTVPPKDEIDAMIVMGVNDDIAQARAPDRLATPPARRTASRRWRRCSTRRSGSSAAS